VEEAREKTTMQKCAKVCRMCQKDYYSHRGLCTSCANKARDADPARYLARKLADWLRRRGYKAPFPGVAFVRQVLNGKGHRSLLAQQDHVVEF